MKVRGHRLWTQNRVSDFAFAGPSVLVPQSEWNRLGYGNNVTQQVSVLIR